jgi:hypothetical protein
MRWLLVLLALLLLNSAAAIQISEIMYDLPGTDTHREWIEIHNNNSSIENLTGWKFVEGGANHSLTLTNGSWILDADAYAIIADNPTNFLQDNPNYTGTLFDSSFSLSNTGECLALRDSSLLIVENITYSNSSGANGNNNSLQLVTGTWCEGNPTPGAANSCAAAQPPQNESNATDQTENTTIENKSVDENKTAPFLVSILDLPAEIKQNESFIAEIEVTNNFNETKTADIYSYAYSGSTLATEGGWTGNLQTFNLSAGKSIVVNLTNKIKSDAIVGTYSFKIRASVDGKKYDTISVIEVLENKNITAEVADENLTQEISSEKSASEEQNHTTSDSTGESVWRSGSTSINLAYWLFTAVLLILVIVLLLTLLRKQNP